MDTWAKPKSDRVNHLEPIDISNDVDLRHHAMNNVNVILGRFNIDVERVAREARRVFPDRVVSRDDFELFGPRASRARIAVDSPLHLLVTVCARHAIVHRDPTGAYLCPVALAESLVTCARAAVRRRSIVIALDVVVDGVRSRATSIGSRERRLSSVLAN